MKFKEAISNRLSSRYHLNRLNEEEKRIVKENLEMLNHKHVIFVAFLFLIIQIIFLVYDTITGFYEANKGHGGYLNLITEIAITISAAATIYILRFSKNKRLKTIVSSAFYYILAAGMCAYIYTDINRYPNIYPIALFYIIGYVARPNTNFYRNLFHYLAITLGNIGVNLYVSITQNTDTTLLYSLVVIIFCFIGSNFVQTSLVKNEILLMENKKLQKELIKQSNIDQLTRAQNRYSIVDEYNRMMENKDKYKQIGVIMFDIDYFKSYNDHFSHVEGDVILVKIVNAVK